MGMFTLLSNKVANIAISFEYSCSEQSSFITLFFFTQVTLSQTDPHNSAINANKVCSDFLLINAICSLDNLNHIICLMQINAAFNARMKKVNIGIVLLKTI
jgi:hypothetical protein